jgi:hypothetical protein
VPSATDPGNSTDSSTYRIVPQEYTLLTRFSSRYGTRGFTPVNRAEELATATAKAWKGRYEGNAKKIFLQSLLEWNDERKRLSGGDPIQKAGSLEAAYINVITIIQSSGTGKSRLLHETAADVFTVPINLRASPSECSDLAVAPADQVTLGRWISAK